MAKNTQSPSKKNGGKKNQPKSQPKRKTKVQVSRQLLAKLPSRDAICNARYALAVATPFAEGARGACLPGGGGGLTFNYSTRLDSEIVFAKPVGSMDLLGVSIIPCSASDGASLYYSEGVGTTAPNSYATQVNSLVMIGSPFVAADFSAAGLTQRLIGCAFEFTPMYTPYNVSVGRTMAYSTNAEQVVDGVLTQANAGSYQGIKTAISDGTNKSIQVMFVNSDTATAQEWQTSSNHLSVAGTYSGGARYAHMWAWLPPDSNGDWHYKVRAVCHWEVRGHKVAPFGSPNDGGIEGQSRVINASAKLLRTGPADGKIKEMTLYDELKREGADVARELFKVGRNAAVNYGSEALMTLASAA